MSRLLAFAAIYLIWGSTYLAIRVGVEEVPPFVLGGARFLLSGAILYVFGRRRSGPLTRREWLECAGLGLLFFTATHGLGHWAQARIPSGTASVIVATVVFWIAGLDAALVKHRFPRPLPLLCIVLGFAGVLVLVAPWKAEAVVDPAGVLAMLGAPVAWALASIWSRCATRPRSLILASGAQMLVGGAALLGLATASGSWTGFDPRAVGLPALSALVYLILFGSIVAFLSYRWLLTQVDPSVAATYAFVNPLVAVLLGASVLGEELSARLGVALGLIVVPVALLQWDEFRHRRFPRSSPGPPGPGILVPTREDPTRRSRRDLRKRRATGTDADKRTGPGGGVTSSRRRP